MYSYHYVALGWNEASSRCWRLSSRINDPPAGIVLDARGRVTMLGVNDKNTCYKVPLRHVAALNIPGVSQA